MAYSGTAIQATNATRRMGMKRRLDGLFFWPLSVLLGWGGWSTSLSHAQAQAPLNPLVTELGKEFTSATADVNGIRLHYVRGGDGPAVILIHGFPQDWFEFHAIMPRLAKRFTVIAVDLRGIGGSTATPAGYDAPNMAMDVHQLVLALKLRSPYVVGHDIGGMVAYAFVRRFPEATRGARSLTFRFPELRGGTRFRVIPVSGTSASCRSPDSPKNWSRGVLPITSITSSNSLNSTRTRERTLWRLTPLTHSYTRHSKCTAHFLLTRNSTRPRPVQTMCHCSSARERVRLLQNWLPNLQRVSVPTDAVMSRPA